MSPILKYNNYIDFLDFRIESIKHSIDVLEKSPAGEKNEKRKQYYLNVAYFVHAIYENYDLKLLFDELLTYSKYLRENKDYSQAVKKIRTSIKRMASIILTHRKFDEFENKDSSINWINPFDLLPLLKVRPLLELLQAENSKPFRISYDEIYSLYASSDGLNGILYRFIKITKIGFNKIFSELATFRKNLYVLAFHDKFQSDYLVVGYAIQLQLIYRNLQPLFVSREGYESFYKSILEKGKDISESNNLLYHCIKTRDYLMQRLNTKLSIGISITRFKHYMEVFYKDDSTNSERHFEKEFELFMFNNGYFALSEGQLGNARYDNII